MNKILRKAIILRSKLKNQANKSKVTRDIKMYKQQRHLEVRLNKDSKYSYFSNLHIRKESKPVLEQLSRRKIAPNSKTNLNPNPNPNRGYFSSGAIVWLPPNPKINPNLDPKPNPNQGGWVIFLGVQLSGYRQNHFGMLANLILRTNIAEATQVLC